MIDKCFNKFSGGAYIKRTAGPLALTAVALACFSSTAFAQDDKAVALEELVVTGSRLRGTSENAPSPVDVFTGDDVSASGGASIQDFLFDLPLNVGTESQPNIFNQNFSAGTENLNFRGLGLGSTLVLFNGRRAPLSGALSQDGTTFVDVSVLPKIFVERVEVLKDGGSAIYGSEAVAGVANFILRKNVQGFEVQGGYQSTFDGPADETDISFIGGKDIGDSTNVTFGLSYFDRSALNATERDFTTPTLNAPLLAGTSAAGQPGNFISPAAGGLVADPECSATGGFNLGPLCRFNFIQFAQLAVPEERIQGYGRLDHDFGNDLRGYAELIVAKNEITGQTLPLSTPTVLGGGPIIPASNPFNTIGEDVVLFIGRPFGANAPAGIINRNNDTQRFALGLEGNLSGEWTWDASFQHGENEYSFNFPDVAVSPFRNALSGRDAAGNFTGEFFDVFGATNNSQALVDTISVDYERTAKTELQTFELGAAGPLFDMPAGSVQAAVGVQVRREGLEVDFGQATESFDLGFLIGGSDFDESRSVSAVYAEVGVPLSNTLDAQLAVRYEDYQDFGSSVDPKIALRWQPNETIGFRASYATAFRAPSLQQAFGNQTGVEFIPGATAFVTVGNPNLENEESDSLNIGAILSHSTKALDLRLAVDYFQFSYDNVITVDNIGGLVSAFNANGAVANPLARSDAFAAGTPSQVATVGSSSNVAFVVANFINAASQEVSGVDVNFSVTYESSVGVFDGSVNASFFNKFDIQETPGGATIDALGSRNLTNFARTIPDYRINSSFGWTRGNGRLGLNVRYTDGFINDEEFIPSPLGGELEPVDSHVEVDLLYNYDFSDSLSFNIGVLNLLDEEPPYVDTNFNFDSQIHDPRGRIGYIRFTKRFGQ